jgi:hypothetical protein
LIDFAAAAEDRQRGRGLRAIEKGAGFLLDKVAEIRRARTPRLARFSVRQFRLSSEAVNARHERPLKPEAPSLRDSREVLEKRLVSLRDGRQRLFKAGKTLACDGAGELELQAFGAAGNRLACGDRILRLVPGEQPLEMAAAELEIGAELVQRVEA